MAQIALVETQAPLDKSSARVRRMFGRIAGRYDLVNHLLSLNVDRYWRWRTVRAAPPVDGPLLDLCTGTGDLALAYDRAAAGGTQIVGSDFCHEMLVLGRQKGQRAGAGGRIRFVEADAQQLPFRDDTFAIVSVAFGLRNIADTRRGLAEMVRVCRPGGSVVVLEFALPQRQPLRFVYGWYFHRVLPWIGRLASGTKTDAYHYLQQSVGEFPSGEALCQRMQSAGLVDVRCRRMTLGTAAVYVGTKQAGGWRLEAGGP